MNIDMNDSLNKLIHSLFASMALTSEDILNFLFSMISALLIGVIISQIYKRTQRGLSHEQTFVISLVLLAPVVTLVMLFIRGNLILSLGLIGSLSIIRFRSPIKDTRDMVFLFWSIVVGLGMGTYNWSVTFLGSIVLVLAIFILYLARYGRSQNTDYVLVVSGVGLPKYDAIKSIVDHNSLYANIRSQELHDDGWEIVFELAFEREDGAQFEDMIYELKDLEPVKNVSLLAPQLSLPA